MAHLDSKWIRLGKLDLGHLSEIGFTRFQIPNILPLSDKLWRLFVTARKNGNANIITLDIDPSMNMKVINAWQQSIDDEVRDSFARRSIFSGSWIHLGEGIVYYFTGVKDVPHPPYFEAVIGRLRYDPDVNKFERIDDSPIVTTDKMDPLALMTPCVLKVNGKYVMWYSSSQNWEQMSEGKYEHTYFVRRATSLDGKLWAKDMAPAIDFSSQAEGGIARPWVIQTSSGFEMWYCYRPRYNARKSYFDRSYKIGYAVSLDGVTWSRRDAAHSFGIQDKGAWDYEMQCYPTVIPYLGKQYLFYSGNTYGDGGIGYAVRDM